MKYKGKDEYSAECQKLIDEKYYVFEEIPQITGVIHLSIKTCGSKSEIASVLGFTYNYETGCSLVGRPDAFHIKSLWTDKDYLRRGLATYLMKEIIKRAEKNKVKHITVNPCATSYIILQENLERFYKSFVFSYKHLVFTKEREIEFKCITD